MMKERLRRIVLFAVTVVTGAVMILFDVPLIFMIPLIIAVGFIILVLLGAITRADIRSLLKKEKPQKQKQDSIFKRPGGIKLFGRKGIKPEQKQPAAAERKDSTTIAARKTGIGATLRSFASSVGSLGTILRERGKREKKVEDIDKLLDKTVSEKVKSPPLSAGAGAAATPSPAGGGAAAGAPDLAPDKDPFLSLSTDEFDAGLFDGLEDMDALPSVSAGPAEMPAPPGAPSGSPPGDNDVLPPLPSMDTDSEASAILSEHAPGPGDLGGLDAAKDTAVGGEEIGDLDSLSLDDIDLDLDLGDEGASSAESTAVQTPAAVTGPKSAPGPAKPAVQEVKPDWVQTDKVEDQISTESDMVEFAGGGGGSSEDLLSSIASDVKRVKKGKDLSLLRELKDFKAPASDLELELGALYDRIRAIKKTDEKKPPASDGIK